MSESRRFAMAIKPHYKQNGNHEKQIRSDLLIGGLPMLRIGDKGGVSDGAKAVASRRR